MEIKKIKENLLKEVKQLKDERGFLYAGLPRFKGLFGRDSAISAWQLLYRDPLIAKNTLEILAEFQGKKIDPETGEEPGKILHEFYPDNISDEWFERYKGHVKWLKKGVPVYFSVDATPLFIILLGKYYKQTGDKALVKKLWQTVERILQWFPKQGYIKYIQTDNGLISHTWKDGREDSPFEGLSGEITVVEPQGYFYMALLEAKKLAKVLGKDVGNLAKVAEDLKKRFEQDFWMEDKKFYCLCLDGEGNQVKTITSNPGHLLFTGILEKEKANLVAKRLFADDMITDYGIRTHSSLEKNFDPLAYQKGAVWPHDNWIIAQGIKTRYKKGYKQIKDAMIKAYEEIGYLPEFYGVVDGKIVLEMNTPMCHPQAWSTGTLLNLIDGGF